MEVQIRRAKSTDSATVGELATALVRFEADRRASFRAVLADPAHDLLVAEEGGRVVGYVHLLTYHDLSHGALAGELLGLVVREDMRRRGIATALMREIISLAGERDVGEFHINTEEDNRAAKALYAGLGAEVVGVQMEIELSDANHHI